MIAHTLNCLSLFSCQYLSLAKPIRTKKHLFQVFVPVNLRRFFPSITLRNFSLYVRTKFNIDKEISFPEIVAKVKEDFSEELQKDKLQARIVANVKWEKHFLMRIIPLFMKKIGFKIGYNIFGESANSFSLSNRESEYSKFDEKYNALLIFKWADMYHNEYGRCRI